jgi:soluble cytochrome b562
MAAAPSKPVAYQVSVIILSLILVVLGTILYMEIKNSRQLQVARDKSEADRKKVEAALTTRDTEFDDLKKLVGNNYEAYGVNEPNDTGKVRGATLADIQKADVVEPTTKSAISKLLQLKVDLTNQLDKQRSNFENLQASFLALDEQHKKTVALHDQARKKAEDDLSGLIKTKDEEVRSKQKQIDDLRQGINELQTELDNEKLARAKEVKEAKAEHDKLVKINDKLREELELLTQTSFEVADGQVRWVDNQNKLVWINLGEADNLRKRTTFSVYTKSHHGVARGSEDIKGAIEVTRIVDAHTAEARIIKDDLYQPIAKGDPIFTPLWSPGRTESFSFVGIIDLDGDGKSDRQRLHELIAAAGGSVDNEVDDDGKRIRYTKFPSTFVEHDENTTGIDVNTKFLVMGKIPDLALAVKEEDKENIARIIKHRTDLLAEARLQGVRIVNLNDFLSWIGYQPQRRLYEPGTEGYPLNAGKRPAPVDTISGKVSGAISSEKRIKPQTSTGLTSPLFRGGSSK